MLQSQTESSNCQQDFDFKCLKYSFKASRSQRATFFCIFTLNPISMNIIIINGPNLNLLGKREPEVYGTLTFEHYFATLQERNPAVQLHYFQSNIEGELIDKLHQIGFSYDGIILNPGAYTHTSIAIADAIKSIPTPVIEVHISNTFAREEFRHQSFTAPNAKGIIIGFGLKSYELALNAFI
jgi:3-dehydroquinate dehydratase-2